MKSNGRKKRKPIPTNGNGEGNGKLTYKQQRFVEEYLVDGHPQRAALRAGYGNGMTVYRDANFLMQNPKVKAAIEQRRLQLQQKTEITQERVLSELACIAFFNPRELYDEQGQLLPLHMMPEQSVRALQVLRMSAKGENGEISNVLTAKPYNKHAALEALSRHLGLFEKDNTRKLDIGITGIVAALGLTAEQTAQLRMKLLARITDAQPQLRLVQGGRADA